MILVKDQNNQMILNDNVKWLRRRQLCKFKAADASWEGKVGRKKHRANMDSNYHLF